MKKPQRQWIGAAVLAAGLLSADASLANDIVISGGRVIDPETGLDAAGMVVAPGFIDLHTHGQNIGDSRMQVMETGMTTNLFQPQTPKGN